MKLLLILMLTVTACASRHKAEELNVEIENAMPVSSGLVVGLSDSGEMISQKKVYASEELRVLQNETYSLEAKVYGGIRYLENSGLYGALQLCYRKLARHTGTLSPMSERRNYVVPETEYRIGINKKRDLIAVEREYLLDRIDRFKRYRQVLTERTAEYEDKISTCELELNKVADK